MVRNDHWSLDQDLEGAGSLDAVLGNESFVLPQHGMGPMVGLYRFRGCKGLQRSKVNVVSQGGMASAFAKASSFAKASEDKSADKSVPSQFFIFQESMSRAILSSVFCLLHPIFCR
jgi:hypothetical protein